MARRSQRAYHLRRAALIGKEPHLFGRDETFVR
jgi:hypothetical protein